jgi:FdrA protein
VVDVIGYPPPGRKIGNLHFATNLSEAAELAIGQLSAISDQSLKSFTPIRGYVRGLFSGGTLAYEALLGLQAILSPIYSNAPITDNQLLKDPLHSQAHAILDLGGDEFTVGRLHPMLDNDLRIRRMRQEAADAEVGMILLDVVLGEGAHPDPASELAPVIAEISKQKAGNRAPEIVVIVIGTQDDPQDLNAQVEAFKAAGAQVLRSVTEAVQYLSGRMGQISAGAHPPVALDRFTGTLSAINIGLESFYDSLILQGAQAVHVEWRPPAGGNEKLASLLARMKT